MLFGASDRKRTDRVLPGLFFVCVVLVSVAQQALAEDSPRDIRDAKSAQQDLLSYQADIQPIFARHCVGCHQPAKQQGDYEMTHFASLLAGGETGEAAIVPGKPGDSYLLDQIKVIDGHAEMPKAPFDPLSEIEIDRIRNWILQGAIDDSPMDSGPRFSQDQPPAYLAAPTLPSIDVSADGRTMAIAGYHEVVLANVDSGEIMARLVGMSSRINTVRFSPSGDRIVACGGIAGQQGELQVWSAESHELVLSKLCTYDLLCGASWSPDGKTIVFGATDNVIRGMDATDGHQVLFQGAHDDWVRDTVFTADGKHLISVARDMSCKLTEVATERFVDNITSITPGALSGGLSSVAVHPSRDEIVVGGADGIVKAYRVFRQTQRRIGDDANLIRNLPKMNGRIADVAISPDGSRIGAVATIDGKSELRVWSYDFDGELDAKVKAVMAKRVSDRGAEDKKLLNEYCDHPSEQLARIEFDQDSVYAFSFTPDNRFVVACGDAMVRSYDAGGKFLRAIEVAQIQSPQIRALESKPTENVLKKWIASKTESDPGSEKAKLSRSKEAERLNGSVGELIVRPPSISLNSPYDYVQLVVTAILEDGTSIDVTTQSSTVTPDWVSVSSTQRLRPLGNGNGEAEVSFGGSSKMIPMVVSGVDETPTSGAVDFVRDVNPVLSRLGCNQGTCHGAQKGKNGFRLSLRGYDPVFDLRALTDDLSARRINPADPATSMMLRKPLGLTPHEGGTLMSADDPYHAILKRWISDGSELDLSTPAVTSLVIEPQNPTILNIGDSQQLRVVAEYSDGTTRDVTGEAFIESGNTEVASADRRAKLLSLRRGEAPVLARYEGAYAATTLTVMGDRTGYEQNNSPTWTRIDELIEKKWSRMKVSPSGLADDATFLRRVYLDLTGMPPSSEDVRTFLADQTATRAKRSAVVDKLIGSESYVDYWTNKWADLLQVNRKFLGVEGSKLFRGWIRESVAENKPYDQFARQILTATGSNREIPQASYFKVLRNPEDTMENTTHLFLGIRFNCNKCHDHPFERWTQDQYYEMAAFFARTSLKKDPKSGDKKIAGSAVEGAKPLYEEVVDADSGEVMHPRLGDPVEPTFPFDVPHDAPESGSRREALAAWMTDPDNPYFARSYANRIWGYLMGRGLIEPIDDIRAGNPPTNPELLDHLTDSFVDSEFDFAELLRQICNSRSYQLSVATNPFNEDDDLNYSHAAARRLPAEVIYDSVHALTGAVPQIPGVAKGTRAAALSDSGVRLPDGFLQNLGRPARESACECERSSELQLGPVMALISGPTIGTAIADPKNELEKIVASNPDDQVVAEEIFLRALGRTPNSEEIEAFTQVTELIKRDHEKLESDLAEAEAAWQTARPKLEGRRLGNLTAIESEIAEHKKSVAEERAKMESDRKQRIADAEAKLSPLLETIDEKVDVWSSSEFRQPDWYPLLHSSLSAGKGTKLIAQQDRSIIADGKRDAGTYTMQFRTKLKKITGFRLEAIADEALPSNGPGLGSNGNFVLTEIQIDSASLSDVQKTSQATIHDAKADFTQDGFSPNKTFNGKQRDQGGWAVSGATGVDHWIVFKLKDPIENPDGIELTFRLHQFHKAKDHRLGRFRISASTDADLPLGLPESLNAIVGTPKPDRTDDANKFIRSYVQAVDKDIRSAKAEIAKAKQPIPADEVLAGLNRRKEKLSTPTPDDPALVDLRNDFQQSTKQVNEIRLTAAEDLTWALINSPAFLFNH